MAGEGEEVCAQLLEVDRETRRGLRAVEQDRDAAVVGQPDDVFHRGMGADGVGDVGTRDDLRALREQRLVGLEIEGARVVDRDHAKLCPLFEAQLLPGNEVRVVLERAHDHLVALAHVCAAV